MKIVFFGTSDRSIPILESLKRNFELVLCVTKTDTKIGRHQEIKESGVKRWASRSGIYYIETPGFKEEEIGKITKEIVEQKVDLAIVCDFAFIIPYKLIETLGGKFINIHFSMLPKYRGASPIQFCLLNGDKSTGVTFHLVQKGMDDGAIIAQYEYIIPNNITSGDLYTELFRFAAEKLPFVIDGYTKGQLVPLLQDLGNVSYTYFQSHPKSTFIYKEDARIDWSKSPQVIDREIRAFNPWPISWGRIGELEQNTSLLQGNLRLRSGLNTSSIMKIYKAELQNDKLKINEIQIEGKRRMSWDTFRNGYTVAA